MKPTRSMMLGATVAVMLSFFVATLVLARAAPYSDVPAVAIVFDGIGVAVAEPSVIQVAAVPLSLIKVRATVPAPVTMTERSQSANSSSFWTEVGDNSSINGEWVEPEIVKRL